LVKRLLRKYRYPPDLQDAAVQQADGIVGRRDPTPTKNSLFFRVSGIV